ncbi:MAG: Hsp20/alpha crystallin family protein [Bacteroidota bacterium]
MTLARMNHPFPSVFNSVWNDFFETDRRSTHTLQNGISRPKVNILETETGFQLELAAPGLQKVDFELGIEKDVLLVKAHKEVSKETSGVRYNKKEFSFGVFERKFHLPETINREGIEANYEAGILTISLPKKEEATVDTAKKIEVK